MWRAIPRMMAMREMFGGMGGDMDEMGGMGGMGMDDMGRAFPPHHDL